MRGLAWFIPGFGREGGEIYRVWERMRRHSREVYPGMYHPGYVPPYHIPGYTTIIPPWVHLMLPPSTPCPVQCWRCAGERALGSAWEKAMGMRRIVLSFPLRCENGYASAHRTLCSPVEDRMNDRIAIG